MTETDHTAGPAPAATLSTSAPVSGFAWLDLRAAFQEEPQPLDFVLPGLLAGTVGALVSPGGTGKTMLALQAAVTLAGGPDVLELAGIDPAWRSSIGRVVYLTGEDPTDILRARLHAIGRRLTPAQHVVVSEHLAVAPLVGCGADLMSKEWQQWIATVTLGARLVVVDTLQHFHRLDENDARDMAGLLASMEQLARLNRTTVLFLHHTSKLGALNGGDTQQASRGSSVLIDNARWQANLITMGPDEAKRYGVDHAERRNFVRLCFAKLNYCAPMRDAWFRRWEGGVLMPSAPPQPTARPRRHYAASI